MFERSMESPKKPGPRRDASGIQVGSGRVFAVVVGHVVAEQQRHHVAQDADLEQERLRRVHNSASAAGKA